MSSGKRKVVPVSELFDRLVSEHAGLGLPHSALFQAALRVCAEDSKRAQRGEAPAEVWALVQRAREVLAASHPAAFPDAHPDWGAPQTGESSGIRFSGLRPHDPAVGAAAGAPDDESAISFEKADDDVAPAPPPVAPEESLEFELVGEAPAAGAPPAGGSAPPPAEFAPEARDEAPLSRPTLEPETEEDREPVSPVLKLGGPVGAFQDLFPEAGGDEPAPPEAQAGGSSSLLFRAAMVGIALLAAAVAVVILWPGVAPRPQVPTRIVESFPAPRPTAVPAGALPPAVSAPASLPTTVPPPAPTRAPAAASAAAPARIAPPGAPALAPTSAPRPARAAEVEGVETMASSDWAGRPPTFVVHFASYKSRDNATADAARLARELGRPAHALAVDLGDKGVWYRVVVGDFASAADARAFRAEVTRRITGDVGGVYRLAAP